MYLCRYSSLKTSFYSQTKIKLISQIKNGGLTSKLPYSVIVKGSDGLYYGSGRLPKIENNKPVSEQLSAQTKEVMEVIKEDLKGVGLTYVNLLKVKIMLNGSMGGYGEVNQIYSDTMKEVEIMPVRECKAYAGLPFGALIEISYVADPGKSK